MVPDSDVSVLINAPVDIARAMSLLIHLSKSVSFMGYTIFQWSLFWVYSVLGIMFYSALQRRAARLVGDNIQPWIDTWQGEIDDKEQGDREEFFQRLMDGDDDPDDFEHRMREEW